MMPPSSSAKSVIWCTGIKVDARGEWPSPGEPGNGDDAGVMLPVDGARVTSPSDFWIMPINEAVSRI